MCMRYIVSQFSLIMLSLSQMTKFLTKHVHEILSISVLPHHVVA